MKVATHGNAVKSLSLFKRFCINSLVDIICKSLEAKLVKQNKIKLKDEANQIRQIKVQAIKIKKDYNQKLPCED